MFAGVCAKMEVSTKIGNFSLVRFGVDRDGGISPPGSNRSLSPALHHVQTCSRPDGRGRSHRYDVYLPFSGRLLFMHTTSRHRVGCLDIQTHPRR